MFCNTCHNQKYVRDERGVRPCPECYGMALSCCEGTPRELDHQKVPGVFAGAPVDWTPRQIAEFERKFNELVASNIRSNLVYVPGGARFRPWSIPVGRPRPKAARRA
jgi:hypothetical protein